MAYRFNPPPNWPVDRDNWQPPPGWQPDPSWGPAPEGWNYWVDDSTPRPVQDTGAARADRAPSPEQPAPEDAQPADADRPEPLAPDLAQPTSGGEVPVTTPGQSAPYGAGDEIADRPAPYGGSTAAGEADRDAADREPAGDLDRDAAGDVDRDAAGATGAATAAADPYGPGPASQAPVYGQGSAEQVPYGTAGTSPSDAYGYGPEAGYGQQTGYEPQAGYGQQPDYPAQGGAYPQDPRSAGAPGAGYGPGAGAATGGEPQKKGIFARFWWLFGCVGLLVLAAIVALILIINAIANAGDDPGPTTMPTDPITSQAPATADSTAGVTTAAGAGDAVPVASRNGAGSVAITGEWVGTLDTAYGAEDLASHGEYLLLTVTLTADEGTVHSNPYAFPINYPDGREVTYLPRSFSIVGNEGLAEMDEVRAGETAVFQLAYDTPRGQGGELFYEDPSMEQPVVFPLPE